MKIKNEKLVKPLKKIKAIKKQLKNNGKKQLKKQLKNNGKKHLKKQLKKQLKNKNIFCFLLHYNRLHFFKDLRLFFLPKEKCLLFFLIVFLLFFFLLFFVPPISI